MLDHEMENTVDRLSSETKPHRLYEISECLHKIREEFNSITNHESSRMQLRQHQLYFDLFQQAIEEYFAQIPVSIVESFIDSIRSNIIMTLKFYPTLSDYYFDLSLAYLTTDKTIDYLNGTKTTILATDEQFLHLFLSIGFNAVYSKTSNSYSICVSHKNVPNFFQLNSSTERLLQAFNNYCGNYFSKNQRQNINTSSILKWLVNMTEIHGFVPYFIKMNYAERIIKWLKIERDQIIEIPVEFWYLMLNLLHNLARHWMGAKTLNKLKGITILKEWKETYLKNLSFTKHNESDKDILIVYYLLYAVLLEPKELKKETISNLQHILDYILERTVRAFDSPDLCCGPYNVCEYLNGLAKFLVNDAFLIYTISRENVFNLFIKKFLYFNQTCHETDLNTIICSLLYSIFWSISFHHEFNNRLKSIDEFLVFVNDRAKSECTDEHAVMMKRAAKGILFNLDLIQMDVQPIEEPSVDIKRSNRLQIMISYAHKDTTFCKKLVNTLQERLNDDIWVDFNKLSHPYENDWEEIAKAITQCDVILMIVTENYCSSKSCRREVIHADKRNKRMIPIYQGKDYKAEDWFEIRVGLVTWVRFGDKRTDEEVFEILLGLIKKTTKHEQNDIQSSNTHQTMINTNESPESVSSIDQWTSEQVKQWLPTVFAPLQLTSGRALSAYMNLLNDVDAQRHEYENRLRHLGISREAFANWISSFDSIRSSDRPTKPNQWTKEHIQTWFKENQFSDALFDSFQFQNGSHLMMYIELLVRSSTRIDEEYNRLRTRIGKDSFHLDEYVRFVHISKSLYEQCTQFNNDDHRTVCTIL